MQFKRIEWPCVPSYGVYEMTAISKSLSQPALMTVAFEAGHMYFVTTVHFHVAWRMVLCLDNGKAQCPDVGMVVSLTSLKLS